MFHLERLLCRNGVRILSRHCLMDSQYHKSGIRDIMSAARLGIDRYVAERKKFNQDFQGKEDLFKEKMSQIVAKNSPEFVFTNDLKTMVHLAQNEDDLEIFSLMLNKYAEPNSQLRFSTYNVGPVAMRLYYYLNKPIEAMALLKDKAVGKIFNQVTSFVILLDLLFKQGFYEEVINVYNIFEERQIAMTNTPRDCLTIFFAACYRLNTLESYKEAERVYLSIIEQRGGNMWYRNKLFFVLLAVNQNQASKAVEILSEGQLIKENLNVYVLALAKANRLDDVLSILNSLLLRDNADLSQVFLTKDTAAKLEEIFNKNEAFEKAFKDLIVQYKMHNLLSEKVLDDFLFEEIPPTDDLRDDGASRRREFRPDQKSRYRRY